MDNYLLSNSRKTRQKFSSRHTRIKNWRRQHTTKHRLRWIESLKPESLNIFVGIHGPNKVPKLKSIVQLTITPHLEVTNRHDPAAPPKIYPLGENSTLNIIGRIEFKQLIDKKRNLYKMVIFVIQNEAAELKLSAPPGYEGRLPFYKQRVFCPLAGTKFHMFYIPGSQGTQGAIYKIKPPDSSFIEQYVPNLFNT